MTKTIPYLSISFIREDGHLGCLWATKIESVFGNEDHDEFAGFTCIEYGTEKTWKLENWRVQGIEKKTMLN
jgi:hypothetical protein